jgi:hypothetical protein
MSVSDFTGMRKVTIKDTTTGGTGTFAVIQPENIGSDGFTVALENNEQTSSSYAGDTMSVTATNVSASTIALQPKTIEDLKNVWPDGYDETTGTWQPIIGGCILNDVTFVWEKVCDTKGNVILRHAQIGLGAEFAFTRDDSLGIEVSVYPQPSAGSEYGLAGDFADVQIPFQFFDGVYDSSTDTVDFDSVGS